NLPLIPRADPEMKPAGAARQERREFFAPFNEGDAIALQVFVDADAEGFLRGFEPVEVHMVEREATAAVLLNEREGGTRDRVAAPEPGGDAAHERGLARAEVARERDNISGPQRGGQTATGGFSLLGRVRNDQIHQRKAGCLHW